MRHDSGLTGSRSRVNGHWPGHRSGSSHLLVVQTGEELLGSHGVTVCQPSDGHRRPAERLWTRSQRHRSVRCQQLRDEGLDAPANLIAGRGHHRR